MDAGDWGQLLALSLLWGATFLFVEVALAGGLPPLTLVLARVTLAALALHAVVIAVTGRPLAADRRTWAALAVMGLLNNAVPFGLIFWAQQHVTGGLAAILNATTPLWSVLLAHVVTREEALRPNRVAGVLLGMAGVAVVVGPAGALAGFGDGAALAAQGAVLLAAASYACAGLWGPACARSRRWAPRPASSPPAPCSSSPPRAWSSGPGRSRHRVRPR